MDDAQSIAAFAEKNWALSAEARPIIARAIISAEERRMYERSPPAMPVSMMPDTTMGTRSSKAASSILKRGARMDSFLYADRYFQMYFIMLNFPMSQFNLFKLTHLMAPRGIFNALTFPTRLCFTRVYIKRMSFRGFRK